MSDILINIDDKTRFFALPIEKILILNEYSISLLVFLSIYQQNNKRFIGNLKDIEGFYNKNNSKSFRKGIRNAIDELILQGFITYKEHSEVMNIQLEYSQTTKLIYFANEDLETIQNKVIDYKKIGKIKGDYFKTLITSIQVYCCWKLFYGKYQTFKIVELADWLNISEYKVKEAIKVLDGIMFRGELLERKIIYNYREVETNKGLETKPVCIGSKFIVEENAFYMKDVFVNTNYSYDELMPELIDKDLFEY